MILIQTIPGGPIRSCVKGIISGPDNRKELSDSVMEGKEIIFITNDTDVSEKIVILDAIRRADDVGNSFLLEGRFAGSETRFRGHYLFEPQTSDESYKGQIEW